MHSINNKQQGVATILIVLLVGIALTATTLGVVHTVQSTQNKQVSAHAVTNAQGAAWMLTEATRNYLSQLNSTELTSLSGNIALGAGIPSDLSGSTITVKTVTPGTDPITSAPNVQVDVEIQAKDVASKATSLLNVVFAVTPGVGAVIPNCSDNGGSQFTGRTEGQNLYMEVDGSNNHIRVDGSYGNPTTAASIKGVKKIEVTGDIYIDGTGNSDTIDLLKANGDISVKQSGSFGNVEAGRDLTTGSNPNILNAKAAGNVIWSANNPTKVNKIQAGVGIYGQGIRTDRDGTYTQDQFTKIGTIISRGDATLTNFDSIDGIVSGLIDAPANITFGKDGTVGFASATGTIACQNMALNAIATGGFITPCAAHLTQIVSRPALEPYVPVELKPSLIADADAYPANYSFSYDATTDQIKVKVTDVNGLPNGAYIMYNDHTVTPKINNGLRPESGPALAGVFSLCVTNGDTKPCITFKKNTTILTDADSNRPTDADGKLVVATLITGVVNDAGVIKVAQPSGIWEIKQETQKLPPGIFYFDRDLRINQSNDAKLVNGFLSAGDIQIERSAATMFALNGVPAEVLCGNKGLTYSIDPKNNVTISSDADADATDTVFPPQFAGYPYPTNFCKADLTKLRAPDEATGALPYIGQFAIMAGQQNDPATPSTPPDPSTYQGGNFFVQVSSSIFGRVIAGNTIRLVTGANIDVYGSIGSEARADGKSDAKNNLNGTVKLHTEYLKNLEVNNGSGGNNCAPSLGTVANSAILWSRYL